MIQVKPKIFLDSGAFTAHKLGKTIDIHQYCDFIKEHEGLFDYYSNLDFIGKKGQTSNRDTAEQTQENQTVMEERRLHPLPCFHFGEPFEFLQHYVKNYDYICLGVTNSNSKLIPYLTECFDKYICDRSGVPKVKVHGYGIADIELLSAYPFYSSDATTWMIPGRYGEIIIPHCRQGKWIYNENPWKVAVSTRSPKQSINGKHISKLTYLERKLVLKYIQEKGFTEEGLSEPMAYQLRDEFNIQFYAEVRNNSQEHSTIMYTGVSTTAHLKAVNTILPKMDVLVSFSYCPNQMINALRDYKCR